MSITAYQGYPMAKSPVNLSSSEIELKSKIFFDYGAHDSAVCISMADCNKKDPNTYAKYLLREYAVETLSK